MQLNPVNSCDLSIVVPVFNEEDNLDPLLLELEQNLERTGKTFEIIFVDDKSTDHSLDVLRHLKTTCPFIRIVKHSINSGESAAEATGFAAARGEVIITIDADRQNDPTDIPGLLADLKDDIAVVCGVRRKREDDWLKRISSRTANRFRNWMTGESIADAGCTYRAIRRQALKEIVVFNGMHRFLPTILRQQGYKVVERLVNHRPRVAGVSKYGLGNRAWRGLVDCLAMRWYRARRVLAERQAGEE